MLKAGFIGGGNMAGAIIGGMINSGAFPAADIVVSDQSQASLQGLRDRFGVLTTNSNREVAEKAEIIFLSVKPQVYAPVIEEIKHVVTGGQIIVTIAPGWTLERIANAFGKPCKIVRTMPNTPALVGEGMTAACCSGEVTSDEMRHVLALLGSFGRVEVLPESQMDTFSALCGSSPAFVFMMIEAMADAAVLQGIPRAQAYPLASQAVLGSAKMVLELGKHPGELKDMVCSPGGSTIEGVRSLEMNGMRSAFIEALVCSINKARQL